MYLQFCIFGVGLGWCALHAFTLLLKIELPEVLRRSRRDPLNALPTFYSILLYHESVFSSTCTSLRFWVGSGWALRRVPVLKTSFSTPGFAAPCRRVPCWERLLRLCSHQCVEIWQNMTQMTKYKKGVLYEQYVSKSYQSSTPIWSEVCDNRKQVALFPSFIAKRQPGQK